MTHLYCLLEGEETDGDSFILLRLRLSFLQPPRQKNLHALVQKPGTHIKEERSFPVLRRVARFLDKLAFCGCEIAFAGIDAACRQLPQPCARGITILSLE